MGTQVGDTPQILLSSEHEERNPAFSPDGRWFVYSSSEPGQYEIFVRRLPMTDEKWAISSGGGLQAMWSRDGKEIFYVALDGRMMAVPVSTAGGTSTSGAPQSSVPDVRKTEQRLAPVCRVRRWSALSDGQAHAGFRLGAFPRAAELETVGRTGVTMTLAAGTSLGPYEILAPLGAGGMGEVYKARDTRLERTVAVKVLPQRLSASPEVRQRFEREAKTISQLSHPHICALYDVGREGDVEYLVMEYLEGETLSDRLAKGPLPLEQTLRYGVEIADALNKAHRQGIVHRDLKPANVMITKSGVKLLDFGLAKAMTPAGGDREA